MAICIRDFVPYKPKPTTQIHSNKPLRKDVPKKFSIFDGSQQTERNLLPVRVPAMDSDLPTQKVNEDNGIAIEGSSTETCKSIDNGNDDSDDDEFPPIHEIRFNHWKKQQASQDLGIGHVIEAVDKSVLDKGSHSTTSEKPVPGLNSGNSQDNPVLIGDDEQHETGSEADLSEPHTDSTKSTTGLKSRQASLDTTISSGSKPPSSKVSSKVGRVAELHENDTFVTKRAHSKRVRGSLKRKTRSVWGKGPGGLSECQDSSMDSNRNSDDSDSDSNSNNGSETESESNDRPAQKKRKIDNPQGRTVRDDLLAVNDPDLERANCQDPFGGQDPYNESLKLLATAGDDEPIDSGLKEDSDVISAPESHDNDRSHSPYMTTAPTVPAATAATAPQESVAAIDGQSAPLAATTSMNSALDDSGIPQQVVEVANDKQEWEICGIIDDKDVDGMPHYWVQWSPTLVSESEMGKASALVARYKARLQAQHKQKGGKGSDRLLPSKAGKQAAAGGRATGQTREKKRCGRPRKQV